MLHRARRLPRRHVRADERHATRSAACTRCSPGCCPSRSSRRGPRPAWTCRTTTRRWSRGSGRPGRCTPSTPPSSRRSSSSRCCRAPAACTSTARTSCACCAALAREHGALVIFDEIATGFGRTGTLFAADRCGVVPDIMCVGQGADRRLPHPRRDAVHRRGRRAASAAAASGVLMHGPTFMGNPLACSVALASLDLLETNDVLAQTAALQAGLTTGLAPARELGSVARRARPRRGRRRPARRPGRRRRGRPPRRSSAASGCGRSATSSTRCRRTSPPTDGPGAPSSRRGRGAGCRRESS